MDENPEPVTSQEAAPAAIEEARRNASYGSLLGIALIAAILAVGAFYVWQGRGQGSDIEPEAGVRGGEPVPEFDASLDAGTGADASADAVAEEGELQPQ